MRGQLPLALLAIVFGALETAGGAQELVYLGIMDSQTYPLEAGTLGVVAGGLLVAAGIALLAGSARAPLLAQATAWVSVPTFILTGVITHRAGWPITAIGILFPLLLTVFCWKARRVGDTMRKL
jgi:hypothetical protein